MTPNEKDRLQRKYRNLSVKNELYPLTNDKCSYCELIPGTVSYTQIDHFEPKKKYPERTYDWNNLLPACGRCNGKKSDHDTKQELIVNPFEVNPEQYFIFEEGFIRPNPKLQNNELNIARRTIKVLDLNRRKLRDKRHSIFLELLKDKIEIQELNSDITKDDNNILSDLRRNKISRLMNLTRPEKILSYFYRYTLRALFDNETSF